MALTTIATFRDAPTAHIARARLEASGIPAFVTDEHLVGVQWLYSDAVGGVKVQVPASYAEEARAVVAADRSRELRDVAARARRPLRRDTCPVCGGPSCERTSEGRPARRRPGRPDLVLWTQRQRCGACGHVWPG